MGFAGAGNARAGALAPPAGVATPTTSAATATLVPMRPGHRVALLWVYALYVFAAGTLALVNEVRGAEWVIPTLVVYAVVRSAPLLFYRPGYGWFHPLVFTSVMALLPMARAFPLYAFGLQQHIALPGYGPEGLARLLAFELVLSTLAVLAYYAGFFFLPAPRAPELRFARPRYLRVKVVTAVVLAAAGFAVFLSGQGGLYAHILSWGDSRSVALSGEFYWLMLPTFGLYACLIWFAADRGVVRVPLFWACVSISLSMVFLGTGSRSSVVFAIIIGLLVWMAHTRKLPLVRIVVAGTVSLMLLGVLGEFRRATWRGEVAWYELGASPVGVVGDFVTGEMTARSTTRRPILPVLARVPDEVPHLYGSSYLALVTLPVPRKLWENKPRLVGGQTGKVFFGYGATAVPPGAVAEAYWNFNVPGVVLLFALFGAFHRWLARVYRRYAGQPFATLLLAVTLFLLQPGTDAIVPWLLALVPLLVLAVAFGLIRLPSLR
ncbi:MAG TPA: O-antigen polymerase, partial [Longimicrobium sp.]|nr:O-antigen polymerase [Longimicrobium sp.]